MFFLLLLPAILSLISLVLLQYLIHNLVCFDQISFYWIECGCGFTFRSRKDSLDSDVSGSYYHPGYHSGRPAYFEPQFYPSHLPTPSVPPNYPPSVSPYPVQRTAKAPAVTAMHNNFSYPYQPIMHQVFFV